VIPAAALGPLAATFGLIVGSFLNVCAYRLPLGQSVVRPRSRCRDCGRQLGWADNIPVLSYLALRGRCRSCGARISWAYPAVEAATAAIFLGAALQFGASWLLVSRLVFASLLIVLFVTDLEHRILPNAITLSGILIGLAFSLVAEPGWRSAAIGALAGGGVLLAIAELYYRVRGEEGLGMGDVKMLAMIGAFLGWDQMLLTLVLSSFAGSVVGVTMIALGRGTSKYALPFGTFLALGALAAIFVGRPIIEWYAGMYA
jgi:leader peptidase (prepilin peptidase)/N-methyltransferase